MRTDRLLKLANLLETDATNPQGVKFDLNGWAKPAYMSWSTEEDFYDRQTETVPVNCGTSACALGLAAISGIFKDEGFSFTISPIGILVPFFKDVTTMGFDAAEEFFEITTHQSYQIFDPNYYPEAEKTGSIGELAVAARIRTLVAEGDLSINQIDD